MRRIFENFMKKIPKFNKKVVEEKDETIETIQEVVKEESDEPYSRFIDVYDIAPNRYKLNINGEVVDTMNEGRKVSVSHRNRIGRIMLYAANGKRAEYSVNRIIAEMYLPKTEKDIKYKRNIVHVKDWDITNHHVSNLQWVNPPELYILRSFDRLHKKDRDDEKLYIEMLIRANYDFDDILKVIPFETPEHDIVAIYADMKI